MTPFEAKGWKDTDKFRVIRNSSGGFKPGDIITRSPGFSDDNSTCLMFTNGHSNEWMYLREVERIEPQWNGEGLPPVGTECEFKRYTSVKWLPGVLSYISDYTAVITLHECDDSGRHEKVGHPLAFEFRPIRTERDKAIDEMLNLLNSGAQWSLVDTIEQLYDAGYRKQ